MFVIHGRGIPVDAARSLALPEPDHLHRAICCDKRLIAEIRLGLIQLSGIVLTVAQ